MNQTQQTTHKNQTVIVDGDMIGYQFNKHSHGERTVYRNVTETGERYHEVWGKVTKIGTARWNHRTLVVAHFSNSTWVSIEQINE